MSANADPVSRAVDASMRAVVVEELGAADVLAMR